MPKEYKCIYTQKYNYTNQVVLAIKALSMPNYRTKQAKSRFTFDQGIKEGDFMNMEKLREMKKHMALRGNWKEVKRINKMIEFHGL